MDCICSFFFFLFPIINGQRRCCDEFKMVKHAENQTNQLLETLLIHAQNVFVLVRQRMFQIKHTGMDPNADTAQAGTCTCNEWTEGNCNSHRRRRLTRTRGSQSGRGRESR